MRNFDYLASIQGLEYLYRFCRAAEEYQQCDPDMSAINARRALEHIIRELYNLKNVEISERTSLLELIDGEPFTEFIGNDKILMSAHYVRKMGNRAAHTGCVSKKESFFCLLNIYNVIAAILLKLQVVGDINPFDKELIPNKAENNIFIPSPQSNCGSSDDLGKVAKRSTIESPAPVTSLQSSISEAETRRMYIDLMLKEAHWDILQTNRLIEPSKACIEIELHGMPNAKDVGFADYVLFGRNGKPLAVIEAKKTSVSAERGKHQAELYADCLEDEYGVRPVIYYTNGFQTYIIDRLGYPPRKIYSFHTEGDLERMIQKQGRPKISDITVNDNITDRYYQKMAIKAVCEHFNSMRRKALLVMATGTGKTRVSISLVEVLKRNSWIKNILFLADRNSLVTQAHKNFVKLLPGETTCVLNDNSTKDLSARIVFSTYQTMINLIDTDEKGFSVGRFDLIIVDEAHRSIFGKYGAIFNYFDALLIGLTATPREDIDKSTYDLFEMEQGVPNYAYELQDAVTDGYLVNYTGYKRGSYILSNGIKYSELSSHDKKQLEKIWDYEKKMNWKPALYTDQSYRDFYSSEMFTYINNIDTVDKVLQDLMTHGLKVQCGELIGKTIIFAQRHEHAMIIKKRFDILYPNYDGLCEVIDNQNPYAQDYIDKFSNRDSGLQIAISVDMLDTGIDVPDILNLVIFKPVRSKIKFTQMIGRGTRLSPGIFGNKDKEKFFVFDWCCNLEYFEVDRSTCEPQSTASLTERIFSVRAEIASHLQHQIYQDQPFAKRLHDELKEIMKEQVQKLNENHISVRNKWESVSRFKDESSWIYISPLDVMTLKEDIAPIISKVKGDEKGKRLDFLVHLIELSILDNEVDSSNAINSIITAAEHLLYKASIREVELKMDLLKEIMNSNSWLNPSLQWLENVRIQMRELMKFLVRELTDFEVDIEDIVINKGETTGIISRVTYKQKILDFLAQNKKHPVLKKIYSMEQLCSSDIKELERILWEELGSKGDYEKFTNGMPCGSNVAAFIRSIIGINRKEAVEKFNSLITGCKLNANQEEFLMNIISYVCENGDITRETLVNESPFEENLSLFTSYVVPLREYIDIIHNVIHPQYTSA